MPFIMQEKVRKIPKIASQKQPVLRNMILTDQPRLYFTSTYESHGVEGYYASDIMLFSNLKV